MKKILEIYNRCDDSVADCCWSYRLWEVYSTGFAKSPVDVASSKDNGMAATAKFSKSNLTLTQAGFSEVYEYKLLESKGNEQIKFIGKNSVSGSTETRLFKIKKQSDKYKLTPINTLAKSDTGTVSLIPK